MRLEFFQMIDRVAAFDRDAKTLCANAKVPRQSTVFEGHFPGHALVPGVLLIETMAQACGFLILGLNGLEKMPFLAGVEKAKLRRFVPPDADLEIDAALVHEGSGYTIAKAAIRSDGAAICDAELMFRIMPFPAELADAMRLRASEIGLVAPVAD